MPTLPQAYKFIKASATYFSCLLLHGKQLQNGHHISDTILMQVTYPTNHSPTCNTELRKTEPLFIMDTEWRELFQD